MSSPADPAVVEEITAAFRSRRMSLDHHQAEAFARYLVLLERWNDKINLTAIRDRPTAILRHFVEPAMALPMLNGAGPVMLCVGSGAGIPGLPFKILDTERDCILVEKSSKKATFLREVVDELELEEVRVINGRFEEVIASGELEFPVHVLTARAWTGWGELLGLGSTLMVPGGRAVIFVGDETLRALRRHLTGTTEPTMDREWGPAAGVGWKVRRINKLPHLQQGFVVSLELPQD